MRGIGPLIRADTGRRVTYKQMVVITPDVALRRIHNGVSVDVPASRKALNSAPVERWPGVFFDMPTRWNCSVRSGSDVLMLHAAQPAVDQGVVNRPVRRWSPATTRGSSLAYRVKRDNKDTVSGYETTGGVAPDEPRAVLSILLSHSARADAPSPRATTTTTPNRRQLA
jgi:protein-L-isoaspartate(D-aspartate) O-methyltransferase